MEKTTNELLDEVIQRQLAKLSSLDAEDENYSAIVTSTTKLLEKRIQAEELELKNAQVLGAQELEEQLKSKELELKNEELKIKAEELGLKNEELNFKVEELETKNTQILSEQELEKKKAKVENLLKLAGYGVTLVSLAVTVGVKVWGTKFTLGYEDKGVMPTTEAGRSFVKDLFRS